MKMGNRLLRTLSTLALAVLFVQSGRAGTRAYWNHDLTAGTTRGGWTLSAGAGACIHKGTGTTEVQTDGVGHQGLVLQRTTPFTGDTLTLVVKYSNLTVDHSNGRWVLASFFGGDSAVSFESILYSEKASSQMGNGSLQDQGVSYCPPTSGLMAVVFSRSVGTRVFFQNAESTAFGTEFLSARQGVVCAKGLSRIQIGGCSSDISDAEGAALRFCRPKMTIEGVAILDEEVMAGLTYEFPPHAEEKEALFPNYLPSRIGVQVWDGAQLEDLLRGTVTARINGAGISDAHKDEVLTAMSVKAEREHDSLSKVELQFQLKDGDTAKAVFVECAVVAKLYMGARVLKIAQAEAARYGEDASSWTEIPDEILIRDENSPHFGLHDLKLVLPYGRVETISRSAKWSETGIEEDETGAPTLVLVKEGATMTFTDSIIPPSIHFDAKEPAREIVVENILPALTAYCPFVIPPNTMVTVYPEYAGTLVVRGCCSMLNPDRKGILPSIVLDGGTIANVASDLELASTEDTFLTLKADATVDCAHTLSRRQKGDADTILSLNGHTLTKTGAGRFAMDGVSLANGGAINVREGVMELSNLHFAVDSIPLTVSVEDGADLSLLHNGSLILLNSPHINLVKGSFTAKTWFWDVTVPEGATLVRHMEGDLIRYTFSYLTPRTEPGMVTAMDWLLEGFTIGEGENAGETLLIPGDTIVLPATLPEEMLAISHYKWDGLQNLVNHPIVVCRDLVWKEDVNRLTLTEGVRITLSQWGTELLDGAYVDGSGTLEISGDDIYVSGNATVACPIAGTGRLVFKAGSTLTCAPIVGVRLESAVEGERVFHDEEKGQYRLVSRGMPLEPGKTLTVKADNAAAAAAQAYLKLTDTYAALFGQEAVLKIAAKETAEGTGVWTLSAEIDETKIVPVDATLRAFAESALPRLAETDQVVQIALAGSGTPGLYYSLEMASDVAFTRDRVRTERVLCVSGGFLVFRVPARTGKAAFFKLTAHTTKE